MSQQQYDIIIRTGAGGGTLRDTLKNFGKKILVLERGSFLPKEKANWDTIEVFQKDRYHNAEEFIDDKGKEFTRNGLLGRRQYQSVWRCIISFA